MALAVKYLAAWESQTQKLALALLVVFIGASVGEFLLGKIGSLFRKQAKKEVHPTKAYLASWIDRIFNSKNSMSR